MAARLVDGLHHAHLGLGDRLGQLGSSANLGAGDVERLGARGWPARRGLHREAVGLGDLLEPLAVRVLVGLEQDLVRVAIGEPAQRRSRSTPSPSLANRSTINRSSFESCGETTTARPAVFAWALSFSAAAFAARPPRRTVARRSPAPRCDARSR